MESGLFIGMAFLATYMLPFRTKHTRLTSIRRIITYISSHTHKISVKTDQDSTTRGGGSRLIRKHSPTFVFIYCWMSWLFDLMMGPEEVEEEKAGLRQSLIMICQDGARERDLL